ncbi:hypothetical protein OPT61_g1089 [Boeremia exigua]|uniref:Uncharacterized protein n=1 Tax=Boeremia exigua TaxID=749465 RepID=A0ACC2IRR2_9PLEO|nr:hypothetical protein OPT61_g1089 [Boeremia exigua]
MQAPDGSTVQLVQSSPVQSNPVPSSPAQPSRKHHASKHHTGTSNAQHIDSSAPLNVSAPQTTREAAEGYH